ncbi:hypothetical protein SKAU_G00182320, partial [Synaphobranchus kaupii]
MLESAFPTLPCTVKAADVPWVFREPHILAGYRPPDQTWRYYGLHALPAPQRGRQRVDSPAGRAGHPGEVPAAGGDGGLPAGPPRTAAFHPATLRLYLPVLQRAGAPALRQVRALALQPSSSWTTWAWPCTSTAAPLAHFYYAIEEEWHARVRGAFLPAAAFLAWLSCAGCCYGKYVSQRLPKFA